MTDISPQGAEFLEALARGDKDAQELQDLHEISTRAASGMLELAAEHYAACRVADFWRAEVLARSITEMAGHIQKAHALAVGKGRG